MKIKKLHIEKAGPIENLTIEFNEPNIRYFGNLNISVLVGENGVGKTTILKLLTYSFFREFYEKNMDVNTNNYLELKLGEDKIYVKNGEIYNNFTQVLPNKVLVSSFAAFEQFELDKTSSTKNHFWEKQHNLSDSLGIQYCYCGPMSSVGRTSARKNNLMILEAFYGKQKNSNMSSAVRRLIEVIGYHGNPIIEINPYSFQSRSSVMTESYHNQFREFRRYILRICDRFGKSKLINTNTIDSEVLRRILEYEKDGMRIIKDLWFEKDNGIISISQMSSGEVTMFYRFLPLIQSIDDNCLIVIDEPETHLHPRWIREYIYNLYRIFKNYNAHIVLASHSPMIISDVPRECIIGLQRVNGKIKQYDVFEPTLGGETVSILKEVFHLEDYRGKFTNKKVDEILDLLRNKEFEKAFQIYDDLGTTLDKYNLFKKMSKYLPDDEEVYNNVEDK